MWMLGSNWTAIWVETLLKSTAEGRCLGGSGIFVFFSIFLYYFYVMHAISHVSFFYFKCTLHTDSLQFYIYVFPSFIYFLIFSLSFGLNFLVATCEWTKFLNLRTPASLSFSNRQNSQCTQKPPHLLLPEDNLATVFYRVSLPSRSRN